MKKMNTTTMENLKNCRVLPCWCLGVAKEKMLNSNIEILVWKASIFKERVISTYGHIHDLYMLRQVCI